MQPQFIFQILRRHRLRIPPRGMDSLRHLCKDTANIQLPQQKRHILATPLLTGGARIIGELFAAFMADLRLLPPQYQALAAAEGDARAVADYVAGMTDRYAMKEYQRLFSVGQL